jgi:DNA-binding MarR family transcriptional regulator/GNAT superfamily N-acetyltransferase
VDRSVLQSEGVLALGSRLRALSDQLFEQGDRVYAEQGFPMKARWFPVLATLRSGEALPVTAIAQRTRLSHPYVIALVRKLAGEGLVEDERDPQDERRRLIRLTAEGRDRVARLAPVWDCLREVASESVARSGADLLDALQRFEAEVTARPWTAEIAQRRPVQPEVLTYEPRWAPDFRRLNVEWLEHWFRVEPVDEAVLDDPEGTILAQGGAILFARWGEEIIGTCALRHHGDGVYELTKMGVTAQRRGTGAGAALMRAALRRFRELGGRSLYLETNHVLEPAIRLYRRFGFVDQGSRRAGSVYDRSDVHMVWDPERAPPEVRKASAP